jgi:hypothetical protein
LLVFAGADLDVWARQHPEQSRRYAQLVQDVNTVLKTTFPTPDVEPPG